MKKIIFLFLVLFMFSIGKADTDYWYKKTGLWTSFLLQKGINKKFYFVNECRYRVIESPKNLQQIIVRPSINYIAAKYLDISAGVTYSYNGGYNKFTHFKNGDEKNLWEQFSTHNNLFWFVIKSRIRMEHRFVRQNFEAAYQFQNRIRTQVEIGHNFDKLGVFLYDEIFWLRQAFVHQNWLGINLNYSISDKWSMNMGIMNQYLFREILSHESNTIIRLGAKLTV